MPVFMAYPPWLRVGLPSWWYVATTEGVALQQLGAEHEGLLGSKGNDKKI